MLSFNLFLFFTDPAAAAMEEAGQPNREGTNGPTSKSGEMGPPAQFHRGGAHLRVLHDGRQLRLVPDLPIDGELEQVLGNWILRHRAHLL